MGKYAPYVPQFVIGIKQNIQENINMEKTLVIHPIASGLEDMDLLYYDQKDSIDFDNDITSKSTIRYDIIHHNRIILLGDGNEKGLRAPLTRINLKKTKRFIGPEYAEFLRNKEIAGIFEFSEHFAREYKLTGLFTGELVFDRLRAMQEFSTYSQEELDLHKYEWCLDLSHLMKTCPWEKIPEEMIKISKNKTVLERMNYDSLIYLANGNAII